MHFLQTFRISLKLNLRNKAIGSLNLSSKIGTNMKNLSHFKRGNCLNMALKFEIGQMKEDK